MRASTPSLLLLLLLPLVEGAIVSITVSTDFKPTPSYEIDYLDPLTGQFTKIADAVFPQDGVPTCGVLRDDNTVVSGTQFPNLDACLTTVYLSTGVIETGRHYPASYFNNVAYDKVTKQTFVTVLSNNDIHGLYELLPGQALRKMNDFPVEELTDTSAYSSSKHFFFLVKPNGKLNDTLFAVSTVGAQEGQTIYNVSVLGISMFALVYDDAFGVLYLWGASPTNPATLMSVDFTTGVILKTFYRSSFVAAANACVNKEGTMIYSTVYTPMSTAVIHSLELSSGNFTQVFMKGRTARTMDFQ